MKHAYLIIAHNEFEILRLLIKAIDDVRNDIYIHFDKKVASPPSIITQHSKLFILNERMDVRWADVSMVKVELLLFETAFKKGYSYYHLLSGVDMPLKSQDHIHDFFRRNQGKEFIGYFQGDAEAEIRRKVKKIHLFPRHFRNTKGVNNILRRSVRAAFLRFQYLLRIERNKEIQFKKGTQWVSISHPFVSYLLAQKENILNLYKHTFCSDEIFIQTACWNSSFRNSVFDVNNEARGCMRKIGWRNGELLTYALKDFDDIMQSGMLFARKFDSKHINVVNKILATINGTS